MGDRLRQLLYPLLLPLIVGTIWVCGWVRQQEDRIERTVRMAADPGARQASLFLSEPAAIDTDDHDADAPDEPDALATLGRPDADADEP